MVEWGGLENRCGGDLTEGSNPSLSASFLGLQVYPQIRTKDQPGVFANIINRRLIFLLTGDSVGLLTQPPGKGIDKR